MEAVGELFPGATAVDRLEHSTFLAAASMGPRLTIKTPHASKENIGIAGINLQIGHAVFFVNIQGFGPVLTTIRCHENTAFFIWPESMTKGSNINDVWILRVDNDGGDMFRILESHVLPGLATIRRFVYSIAKRDAVAHI